MIYLNKGIDEVARKGVKYFINIEVLKV